MTGRILEFRDVQKAYGGLRPLRIRHLELAAGQSVALTGLDSAAAEAFVNLATGAALPDTGEVRIFDTPTASIEGVDVWLTSLDKFGIVSERALLLDALTAMQNLAMPLTLEVDSLDAAIRAQVTALAAEIGLDPADLTRPVGALGPLARLRVRLGRALAPGPAVIIAEHPTATLPPGDVPAFAADLASVIAARALAAVTLTADKTFAAVVAADVLTLQPATGELKAASGWRRWFAGR
jgi:predicted ABC-type transport system involved in lysophospholipase L1 biosynthesis ATPase subunit